MRTEPDVRSLDGLRSQAARDPRGAARQAAAQFDAVFTQMVLKSMRDASPKSEGAGPGGDTFTTMLDARFATQFAGRPGGLASMIEQQLTRHLGNMPTGVPAAPGQEATPVVPALDAPALTPIPAAAAAPAPAPAPTRPAGGGRAADFIRRMLPHAQEAERQTGVPASFILGQAALESGWGRSEIRNADGSGSFNLFGIKGTRGWQGATTEVATTEYEGGRPVRQRAAFRSYGSYAEGFADYARMLSSHPRYANVVRNANTPEAFAGGMQSAGYATDPAYARKLARTINMALAVQRSGSIST